MVHVSSVWGARQCETIRLAWVSSLCKEVIPLPPPPGTAVRVPTAANLRVLVHDRRTRADQAQHMAGEPTHEVYQTCP